jgi:hypothetical protein
MRNGVLFMNDIKYRPIPRRYALKWNPERKGLVVNIHKRYMELVPKIPESHFMVQYFKNLHGLTEMFDTFHGDLTKGKFGFGSSLELTEESGDWCEFTAPLPVIKFVSKTPCSHCKGSGFDHENDMRCFRCEETGKEVLSQTKDAYALTSSLGMLFQALEVKDEIESGEVQHVHISALGSKPESDGSYISGFLGVDMCSYLFSEEEEAFEYTEVACDAMREAWIHMYCPGKTVDVSRIRVVYTPDNSFFMDCPGNGTGIHSGFHKRAQDQGMKFSSHHVDGPHQSLTLLVGLAAFLDNIDKALHPGSRKIVHA